MADLSAPCGLFCGGCPLYKAANDPEFNKTLAEKMKVPPEKARCAGCRPCSGKVPSIQGTCATYTCAEAKEIDFCYQCEDFPCNRLSPCADKAKLYPHNLKLFSLLRLQKEGREAWEREYPEIVRRYFRGQMIPGNEPKV